MSGKVAQVTPAPQAAREAAAISTSSATRAGRNSVRRPTRGIVLKEETYATMQVVTGGGQVVKLVDAGSNDPDPSTKREGGRRQTTAYTNFLLQHVVEAREEKVQILETFGEPYVFFFGERPRIVQFQGILMNSWDFNWEAEWWHNYENYLRGTKCVYNDCKVYLTYDNITVSGYIVSCSAVKSAKDPNWVEFNFRLFVTSNSTLDNPELGNPNALQGIMLSTKSGQVSMPSWGKNMSVTYNQATGKSMKAFTASELAPFKPEVYSTDSLVKRLRRGTEEDVWTVYVGGDTPYNVEKNLATGNVNVYQNVNTVNGGVYASSLAKAWRTVQGTLNYIFDTAAQVLSGTVVRVPVGFEGVWAYDESSPMMEALVRPDLLKRGGVLSYGVFSDNTDEYVGASFDYDRSRENPYARDNGSDSLMAQYIKGEFSADQVQQYFAQANLTPLGSAAEVLADMVNYLRMGCVAMNLAKAIATYEPDKSGYFDDGYGDHGGALAHTPYPSQGR